MCRKTLFLLAISLLFCGASGSSEVNASNGGVDAVDHSEAVRCNNSGVSKLNARKYNEALIDFEHAIKLDPSYDLALMNLTSTRRELGDQLGAIADYKELIRRRPEDALTYNQRLIAIYDDLIRLHPDTASYYEGRAAAKHELGHNDAALSDFDKACHIDPTNQQFKEARDLARKSVSPRR